MSRTRRTLRYLRQDVRGLVPPLPAYAVVEPRDAGEPAFISEDIRDTLVAGRYANVPLIVGSNFREGTLYFARAYVQRVPCVHHIAAPWERQLVGKFQRVTSDKGPSMLEGEPHRHDRGTDFDLGVGNTGCSSLRV